MWLPRSKQALGKEVPLSLILPHCFCNVLKLQSIARVLNIDIFTIIILWKGWWWWGRWSGFYPILLLWIFGSSRADPDPVVGADGTIIFHRFIYFVLTNGFIFSPASLLCVQGQFSPSAGVQRCSKTGAVCNELFPHVPAAFVSWSEVFRWS